MSYIDSVIVYKPTGEGRVLIATLFNGKKLFLGINTKDLNDIIPIEVDTKGYLEAEIEDGRYTQVRLRQERKFVPILAAEIYSSYNFEPVFIPAMSSGKTEEGFSTSDPEGTNRFDDAYKVHDLESHTLTYRDGTTLTLTSRKVSTAIVDSTVYKSSKPKSGLVKGQIVPCITLTQLGLMIPGLPSTFFINRLLACNVKVTSNYFYNKDVYDATPLMTQLREVYFQFWPKKSTTETNQKIFTFWSTLYSNVLRNYVRRFCPAIENDLCEEYGRYSFSAVLRKEQSAHNQSLMKGSLFSKK